MRIEPSQVLGTILDAHIHTVRGATDSELQPDDLLDEARRIGLTGINISEHDRAWERYNWEQFRRQCDGLFLSRGMEVSTDLGHIIVFGIDQYYGGIRSAERLRQICDDIGAFMVVAHPFRHFFDPVTFRRKGEDPFNMSVEEAAESMHVFEVVHGIEAGNGGNNRRENEFAYKVAKHLGKTITGGSDAHSTNGIGIYTTVFEEPVQSQDHLRTMLREGRTDCYEGLNNGSFQPFRPTDMV